MTDPRVWWHRKVLGHRQVEVLNGPTEPGVQCYLPDKQGPIWVIPGQRCCWFASDGGRGR